MVRKGRRPLSGTEPEPDAQERSEQGSTRPARSGNDHNGGYSALFQEGGRQDDRICQQGADRSGIRPALYRYLDDRSELRVVFGR